MNRYQYIITCLLVMIMMFQMSCIDELNIDTEEEQIILIVEGFIDTDPGPHSVILSKSAKYGSIFEGFVRKEEGAFVRIRDEEGNQVLLTETSSGIYETPESFSAKVGSTYTMIIELANGTSYISTPETVAEAPKIEELIPVFEEKPSVDDLNFNSGVQLFARINDPAEDNYYFWRTNGVYIINTNPELFTFIDGQGNRIPAPKDCCPMCWITEENADPDIRIFSDNLSNGNEITTQIAFLNDDGGRFQTKYMAAVEQYSLTREAYQFYRLLDNQLSIEGDIFDPPPATIKGNFVNLSDPDANVIGYFGASDIYRDTIFIDASIIERPQLRRQIYDDCRVLQGSTTQLPSYWE